MARLEEAAGPGERGRSRGGHWRHGGEEIQIVSNEQGEPPAVIVPIELWREIVSERETAYLMKSETMRQRPLEAKQRQGGYSIGGRR